MSIFKRFQNYATLSFSILLLTGCTSFQVVDQVLEFNRGLEIATNKMMLLNAVRASHRHPMYFSDITQSVAAPKYDGSVSFNLPFGGDATHLFSATPKVGVSKSNSMTLVPLNKQKFYKGILSPVNFANVGQYIHQGWPVDTLLHMFVEKIYINPGRLRFLFSRAVHSCQEKSNRNEKACRRFSRSLCEFGYIGSKFCNDDRWPDVFTEIDEYPKATDGEIKNDPGSVWDFALFRSVVTALSVLEFDVVPSSGMLKFNTVSKKVERKEDAKGRVIHMTETSEKEAGVRDELILLTRVPQSYRAKYRRMVSRYCKEGLDSVPVNMCGVQMHATKKRTGNLQLGGVMRSSQGMLFYLGELIEVQSNKNLKHTVARRLAKRIFPVHFGRLTNASVSVRYNGTTYSIRDDEEGRRAMQLLALVNQLFNLKKESNELPTVPTVISVGG